ncbi:TPA: hypothetical protein ACH3X2_009078 [Trebouxia sp. C0005]
MHKADKTANHGRELTEQQAEGRHDDCPTTTKFEVAKVLSMPEELRDDCSLQVEWYQFDTDNRSKTWAKKQVRPYPSDQDGPRTDNVFVGQCFYGFKSLDHTNAEHSAEFGAWLPDDAIDAVKLWLAAHSKSIQAEPSTTRPAKRVRKSRLSTMTSDVPD